MELDSNGMVQEKAPPDPGFRRAQIGGGLLFAIGLALAWWFVFKPLQLARQSGVLHYYLKAVLLAPALLYAGAVAMMTDMRDGQMSTVGPDGLKRRTRKGKLFIVGLVVAVAVAEAAWLGYLHLAGFEG